MGLGGSSKGKHLRPGKNVTVGMRRMKEGIGEDTGWEGAKSPCIHMRKPVVEVLYGPCVFGLHLKSGIIC